MTILNRNRLNRPIKRKRSLGWIKKKIHPIVCSQQVMHFKSKDINRQKKKGGERIYDANIF